MAKRSRKQRKPHPQFPLTPRADGRWFKKINGRHYYFTGDHVEALKQYEDLASRMGLDGEPEHQIRDLLNHFMDMKDADLEAGHLSRRAHRSYEKICDTIVATFGRLKPLSQLNQADAADLRTAICKGLAPQTQSVRLAWCRSVFVFGRDQQMMSQPFHKWIRTVRQEVIKRHKGESARRIFSASEVRELIEAATSPLKAMILLAINCGFGNHDCADLTREFVDLEGGWHTFPRPKTGETRRGKLWPETVAAIVQALEGRPKAAAAEFDARVFLMRSGRPWIPIDRTTDNIGRHFRALAKQCGLYGPGVSFYRLRHTHQTIGSGAMDEVALRYSMGHSDPSMSARYRHGIADERLEGLAGHLRAWLFDLPSGDAISLRIIAP